MVKATVTPTQEDHFDLKEGIWYNYFQLREEMQRHSRGHWGGRVFGEVISLKGFLGVIVTTNF